MEIVKYNFFATKVSQFANKCLPESSVCIITQLLIQFGFGIICQFNLEHCLECFGVSLTPGIFQRILDIVYLLPPNWYISLFLPGKSLKTELIPNNLLFITESFCDFPSPLLKKELAGMIHRQQLAARLKLLPEKLVHFPDIHGIAQNISEFLWNSPKLALLPLLNYSVPSRLSSQTNYFLIHGAPFATFILFPSYCLSQSICALSALYHSEANLIYNIIISLN